MKPFLQDLAAFAIAGLLGVGIWALVTTPTPGHASDPYPEPVVAQSAPPCEPPPIVTLTRQFVVDDPTSGTVVLTVTRDVPSTLTVELPIGTISVGEWWCQRQALDAQLTEARRVQHIAKIAAETYLREEDVLFAIVSDPRTSLEVEPVQ